MKKRTSSNIKKKISILMLVLYLVSMIAVAVSIETSSSANTGSKDSGISSKNINYGGQSGIISVPHIKGNENYSTATKASTAA